MKILILVLCGCFFVACTNNNEKKNEVNTDMEITREYKLIDADCVLIEYDKSKMLKTIYQIMNGQKEGFYRVVDNQERTIESGTMINNVKNGNVKIYADQKLARVSYYENNELVFDLDTSDFNLENQVLAEFNISLPKSWEKTKNLSPSVLLVCKKKCDSSIVFCPVITLTQEALKIGIDEYADKALLRLSQSLDKFKIIQQNKIKLHGVDVIQVKYLVKKDNKKIGFQSNFIAIGKTIYVLSCSALNEQDGDFLRYDGLYDEILLTLKKS